MFIYISNWHKESIEQLLCKESIKKPTLNALSLRIKPLSDKDTQSAFWIADFHGQQYRNAYERPHRPILRPS